MIVLHGNEIERVRDLERSNKKASSTFEFSVIPKTDEMEINRKEYVIKSEFPEIKHIDFFNDLIFLVFYLIVLILIYYLKTTY